MIFWPCVLLYCHVQRKTNKTAASLFFQWTFNFKMYTHWSIPNAFALLTSTWAIPFCKEIKNLKNLNTFSAFSQFHCQKVEENHKSIRLQNEPTTFWKTSFSAFANTFAAQLFYFSRRANKNSKCTFLRCTFWQVLFKNFKRGIRRFCIDLSFYRSIIKQQKYLGRWRDDKDT